MVPGSRYAVAMAALLLALLAVNGTGAAGEKQIVYGADTTDEERLELGVLFGAGAAIPWQLVSTPEMVANLAGTGLPVYLDDASVSGAAVTCLSPGDGLRVRTANVTRVTAPVYAGALAMAGLRDADAIVAAPSGRAVTGEAALVGALKAAGACGGIAPARAALAYEHVARTMALAGPDGDLTAASTAILRAADPVITGQTRDEATIGGLLDQALADAGIAADAGERAATVDYLARLGALDWGAYRAGYRLERVSPMEARLTMAPAPAADAKSPSQTATASVPQPQAAVPAGTARGEVIPGQAALVPATNILSGEVRRTGSTLAIHADGHDTEAGVAPGALVVRDGRRAGLGDIRPGDRALVVLDENGLIDRIEALSGREGSSSPAAWLAPTLLALAALAGLWWLLGRRRDPFILQRVPARGAVRAEMSRQKEA